MLQCNANLLLAATLDASHNKDAQYRPFFASWNRQYAAGFSLSDPIPCLMLCHVCNVVFGFMQEWLLPVLFLQVHYRQGKYEEFVHAPHKCGHSEEE